MLNRAEEDYIKAIYEFTVEKDEELVKTSDISAYFGFTDQTVNEMIKKLVTRKLVLFLPYKGVKLTDEGKKEAVRMVRSHRIWEVFLTQKLKFNWSDVHEHAETLEHASSEIVLRALYEYLGNPEYCSHGNPIPDENGKMANLSTLSLSELTDNDSFEIVRVLDYPELLSYLNKNNIGLHDKFTVIKKEVFNELWTISNKNFEHVISKKIAKMLYVKKLSD